MTNKFSIRVILGKIAAIISVLKTRRIRTLADFAERAGLPVVDLVNRPANYPGYLDMFEEPRFIAVNRDFPVDEQAWFIAQQVAFCAQQRGVDSLALNRPWKWELLETAPHELKEKILAMDQEFRAYWFMLLFASREEYRPFARKNRKKISKITFTDNIVRFYLYKLWLKIWLSKLYRRLVFMGNPAS